MKRVEKGVVRSLAEPNLTALSGQEAKFLAGGEYPVPIAQDLGQIGVEFKPFGIALNFIPRVIDNDVINLELEASVSAIDSSNGIVVNGFEIDAFTLRQTTVWLTDGDGLRYVESKGQRTAQRRGGRKRHWNWSPMLEWCYRQALERHGKQPNVYLLPAAHGGPYTANNWSRLFRLARTCSSQHLPRSCHVNKPCTSTIVKVL